ncbi:hypothetical protein [Bifidobacterium crudilactis]|jgi:hypothetical protein|uniref:hypothetical protein n=1 Tax=Bifidobacterium crudilactis TaxID=327277 RepID=UPI003A5BB84C
MVIALIIILVTAVGILAVLAVVARVLGHPLITRTHVNGSLVDIDFWNRKESENDEKFEGRASDSENGVTGTDINDAGEVDTAGIHSETSGFTEIIRRWDVEKSVRGKDSERLSEGCGEESHGESAVSRCGDGSSDGIRREHGSATPKRVHGYLTKWNEKYNIFEESEGLWNEEFGKEY